VLLALRRRSHSLSATLRRLDAALVVTYQRGEPLSIIVLALAATASLAQVAAAVRPRLRHADSLYNLAPDQLLIVSPATSHRAAIALSSDLDEFLATDSTRHSHPVEITTATTDQPITATDLLARLAAAPVATPA
jgi:hypothetical protein